MFFYSAPSHSPRYPPSYIPRRSYRPASFYQDDDEPYDSSTFPLEDLAYSPLPAPLPSRMDPEMRYRRALHELEAAEQEFEAHLALERSSQVALARQRAAAEAARRERAHAIQIEAARRERARAIQAEVERLERTRALQGLVEERLPQWQDSFRPGGWCGRAPPPGHDLVRSLGDFGATEDFVHHRRSPGCRRSRSDLTHRPAPRDNEDEDAFSIGDLLKFIAGVGLGPEPARPTQEPTSPAAEPKPKPEPEPQPQSQSQPQPQPATPKRDDGEVTLSNILEFIRDIASQAKDVYQSTHEVRLSFQNVRLELSNTNCAAE